MQIVIHKSDNQLTSYIHLMHANIAYTVQHNMFCLVIRWSSYLAYCEAVDGCLKSNIPYRNAILTNQITCSQINIWLQMLICNQM